MWTAAISHVRCPGASAGSGNAGTRAHPPCGHRSRPTTCVGWERKVASQCTVIPSEMLAMAPWTAQWLGATTGGGKRRRECAGYRRRVCVRSLPSPSGSADPHELALSAHHLPLVLSPSEVLCAPGPVLGSPLSREPDIPAGKDCLCDIEYVVHPFGCILHPPCRSRQREHRTVVVQLRWLQLLKAELSPPSLQRCDLVTTNRTGLGYTAQRPWAASAYHHLLRRYLERFTTF